MCTRYLYDVHARERVGVHAIELLGGLGPRQPGGTGHVAVQQLLDVAGAGLLVFVLLAQEELVRVRLVHGRTLVPAHAYVRVVVRLRRAWRGRCVPVHLFVSARECERVRVCVSWEGPQVRQGKRVGFRMRARTYIQSRR